MRRALKLIIIFILLAGAAQGYTILNGYVTDNANQITPEYKSQILEEITQIKKNSSIEIAILTVPDLNGQTIEQFSIDTAQGNGVGKSGKDNGLLITIAQQERKWRIEVGYGLEGTITDAQAKIIGERYLKPGLAAGNWGKGILDTLNQIELEINKENNVELEKPKANTDTGGDGFILLLITVVAAIFLMAWFNGGGDNSTERRERRRKKRYTGSYHSSGRNDSKEEDSLESDTIHHSYYSGGYDRNSSSDSDSSDSGGSDSGSFGGGGFGGGGASGGF